MKPRILFVDDEKNVLLSMKRNLREHYDISLATSASEALELIKSTSPFPVVVSDMDMPIMDGLSFLQHVKKMYPESIRILLTGRQDSQTAIDGINKGEVFRMLRKPCPKFELSLALTDALCEFEKKRQQQDSLNLALTNIEQLEDLLDQEQHTEHVTGLLNRPGFELELQQALDNHLDNQIHTLIICDLDQFNIINESCGRAGGDEVLQSIASLLKKNTRDKDKLCRLNADKFAMLLSGTRMKEVVNKFKKLQQDISKRPFLWNKLEHTVTASFGLVEIHKGNELGVLNRLEAACKESKHKGRSQFCMFDDHDQDINEYSYKVESLNKFKHALVENRLRLYCQAIVPLSFQNDEKCHYEILVRIEEPSGKILYPAGFMEAVEHYYLSTQLDSWVLTATFDWLEKNPEKAALIGKVGINLSGQSVGNDEIFELIKHRLLSKHIHAEQICFEITESAAIGNMSSAKIFIEKLTACGASFALDDFGTGLSSFAYLKNLPVEYIKIDGFFVKSIHQDEVDCAMVRSITEIGHVMGKKIIAEYVENDLIMQRLRELQVDYVQGYRIGKPVPINEIDFGEYVNLHKLTGTTH